jgi:hypothetical protein
VTEGSALFVQVMMMHAMHKLSMIYSPKEDMADSKDRDTRKSGPTKRVWGRVLD